MTEAQTTAPIIPVIDERLGYQTNAPADHKLKVDKYNELLEEIYQREVELTKMKSALVDMRSEIGEEARILDGTSEETRDGIEDDEEEEEAEQVSDSNGSEKSKPQAPKDKKNYKKTKGKGKGNRRSKLADSELDAEWDYKLELMRNDKREIRASDVSEEVPLRAKTTVTSH